MKNVLVVSDNVELVTFFQTIAHSVSSRIANFNYCYSAINKSPIELEKLGMTVINMRDPVDVDTIIDGYDLVISAHCKQIFPKNLVSSVRCINIHPGLNPYNRGWFPQVFSIINKKPVGCTIHIMDEEIDHGDILYQQEVSVNAWDTSLDVYSRVVEAEKELISKYLIDLINEDYYRVIQNDEGNYNGIADFNELKKLDLSSIGTLAEHIDLLRALTHGDFKNAYFFDKNKEKVFVQVKLTKNND